MNFPFCKIAAGAGPAAVVRVWPETMAIVPLNPVVTGTTMARAAVNLITSVGAAATQTVTHLHIHVVPRRAGDGLLLPWSGQQS